MKTRWEQGAANVRHDLELIIPRMRKIDWHAHHPMMMAQSQECSVVKRAQYHTFCRIDLAHMRIEYIQKTLHMASLRIISTHNRLMDTQSSYEKNRCTEEGHVDSRMSRIIDENPHGKHRIRQDRCRLCRGDDDAPLSIAYTIAIFLITTR